MIQSLQLSICTQTSRYWSLCNNLPSIFIYNHTDIKIKFGKKNVMTWIYVKFDYTIIFWEGTMIKKKIVF